MSRRVLITHRKYFRLLSNAPSLEAFRVDANPPDRRLDAETYASVVLPRPLQCSFSYGVVGGETQLRLSRAEGNLWWRRH